MKNNTVAMVIACGLCACSADAGTSGESAVQIYRLNALSGAIDCGCFWESLGYPSENACLQDRAALLSAEQEHCVRRVAAGFPIFNELVECRVVVASHRYDCYNAYDNTCDPNGFDGCDEVYEADFAACLDPCLSMPSGAGRTQCELDRAELQSDSVDCFR